MKDLNDVEIVCDACNALYWPEYDEWISGEARKAWDEGFQEGSEDGRRQLMEELRQELREELTQDLYALGLKQREIGELFQRDQATVSRWLEKYRQRQKEAST